MRNTYCMLFLTLLLAGFLSLTARALESASEKKTLVQIGIWPPLQLFPEERAVSGVRLSLPYASNLDLTGFSFGGVNGNTRDNRGIEIGVVNLTGRDVDGFQFGLVNAAGRELLVAQFGLLYNTADVSVGLQLGLMNHARLCKGLQMGIINFSQEVTHGAQIGLLNFASGNTWDVVPLIRWKW